MSIIDAVRKGVTLRGRDIAKLNAMLVQQWAVDVDRTSGLALAYHGGLYFGIDPVTGLVTGLALAAPGTVDLADDAVNYITRYSGQVAASVDPTTLFGDNGSDPLYVVTTKDGAVVKVTDCRLLEPTYNATLAIVQSWWQDRYGAPGDVDAAFVEVGGATDRWRDTFLNIGFSAAAPGWRGWLTATPAGDFEGRAKLATENFDDDNLLVALLFYESGTGKVVGVRLNPNTGSPQVETFKADDLAFTNDAVLDTYPVPTLAGLVLGVAFSYVAADDEISVEVTTIRDADPGRGLDAIATTHFTVKADQFGYAVSNGSGGWKKGIFGKLDVWDVEA